MNYAITIHGPIPEGTAKRLWRDVDKAKGNLLVLMEEAFIFGDADDATINKLAYEAGKTGYLVEVERG